MLVRIHFLAFLLFAMRCCGCGINWTLPHVHFDGVDEHGYVAYWETIGQLSLSDGTSLPINIGFNSRRESESPYLGRGWVLPFLESHTEPVDENCMKVLMPDGWMDTFYRNGNTDIWRGNGGWIGETKDTVFTMTAPCGWRMKFDSGRLIEIDGPKDVVLSYKYNGNNPVEIDENDRALVSGEPATMSSGSSRLNIGNITLDIKTDRRPLVTSRNNKNTIEGIDQSLHELSWSDGKTETFDFTTDSSLNPILKIGYQDGSRRELTWDAGSRQIERDGPWLYSVRSAESDNYTDINRTNNLGQSEYFYVNNETGISITQGIDGVRKITKRFVNAANLNGKVKSITQVVNGNSSVLRRFSYDESGKLLREVDANGEIVTYNYGASGEISVISKKNNQIVWQREIINGLLKEEIDSVHGAFDTTYLRSDWEANPQLLGPFSKVMPEVLSMAKFLQIDTNGGKTVREVLFDANHRSIARFDVESKQLWEFVSTPGSVITYVNGIKYLEDTTGRAGNIIERREFSTDGTTNLIQKYIYNTQNRAAQITTLDKTGDIKDVTTFQYDIQGRPTEQKSLVGGTYRYFYSTLGERKQMFTPTAMAKLQNGE